MPYGHIFGLSAEVFHLHVKYHVTLLKLVSNGRIMSIREDIKSDSYTIHITGYAISPMSITIFLIYLNCFSHCGRHFNTELMSFIHISWVPLSH